MRALAYEPVIAAGDARLIALRWRTGWNNERKRLRGPASVTLRGIISKRRDFSEAI
jgi:hypothetical protein